MNRGLWFWSRGELMKEMGECSSPELQVGVGN